MKVMTNFRLDKSILDKLDEIAKRHNRTRTGEVKTALLAYIAHEDPTFVLRENPADPE